MSQPVVLVKLGPLPGGVELCDSVGYPQSVPERRQSVGRLMIHIDPENLLVGRIWDFALAKPDGSVLPVDVIEPNSRTAVPGRRRFVGINYRFLGINLWARAYNI